MNVSLHSPLFTHAEDVAAALETLELTELQAAQLNAAANYHSLRNPGARLELRVGIGGITEVPALTDAGTIDGSALDGAVACVIELRSRAIGSIASVPPERAIVRWVRLGHADATPATTESPAPVSLPRTVYRELERRAPVVLDTVRETIMRRRERAISGRLPRHPEDASAERSLPVIDAWQHVPEAPPAGAPQAVLFGLHWLQTGGAERWAVESIQLAKDAGLLPVVVTDQNSVHPWLTRPELEGCIVIAQSFREHLHEFDIALTHAILENFDLSGVMLHHCQWLYLSLPWIKRHRPGLPVVDSLHIVEYLGGGYPGISAQYDAFIDTHHAISPELVRWLTEVQGIDPGKVDLAPLTALTVGETTGFRTRDPRDPFTVSFVGRLSRQKRPDVFLMLVHRLRKSRLPFHAIMHGDGEMRDIVNGLIDQFGLRGIIEQRYEDTPVAATLAETDLLVVTSINEGLTLTTFEAVAAGVPVLSADVGSQRTIVQGEMLAPRPARPFIGAAASVISKLAASEQLRELRWTEQRERVAEFGELQSAHEWMKETFAQWHA
ncbi:glycosyltransferase [Leucobacter chironomi]|uniref:glycosyltransferase n=1 Tax=Leucobacter chironomi TaxID=491918 RepID=UPI000404D0D4|nr:glycosyltransferase [Leucobacter chironomi]